VPSIRDIVEAVKTASARHAQGEGKSLARQATEMLALWRAHRLTPGEYISYGLDRRPLPGGETGGYVSNHWHWHRHLPVVNDSRFVPVLRNKWIFDRYFRSYGFPLPDCVGLLHPTKGTSRGGGPLSDSRTLAEAVREYAHGSVLKPVDGWQGTGVVVLDPVQIENGRVTFQLASGESLPGIDALDRWFASPATPPLIVQERVVNHEALARISPGATSTLRIVTLRRSDGSALIPFAGARIGRQGATIDNYSEGGILASIDVGTGTMGRGHMQTGGARIEVQRHPDTGIQIEGTELPWWPETLDLVRKLTAVTQQIRAVGWDIIISPDGPVVLEGNHDWGIMMMQSLGVGYLDDPEIGETLTSYGVELP
jgi:hypothetical protein